MYLFLPGGTCLRRIHNAERSQSKARESFGWPTPKELNIHSRMFSFGRVDPFEVGYACSCRHTPPRRGPHAPIYTSSSGYHSPEPRVAVDKVVYIGYEQPIEVFRAILPSGREQLLTTEGWELWILQRFALPRHPKKALIGIHRAEDPHGRGCHQREDQDF